ncbi:MAG TPA: pilus assembly protein PilP [Candidatus Acidoferrum sp.]|nr:pilus assembly protein PilP [Candidatus Acidoferrum sp.]
MTRRSDRQMMLAAPDAWLRAGAIAAACAILLTGCSNADKMTDIQSYVDSAVNRPPGQIEPPPQAVSYVAFTYSAASLRSPFDVPVDAATAIRNKVNSKVKPDENRPKEYLENFALPSLTMVGSLARNGQIWALVKDETSNINRVTVGNYMGKSFGRIVSVTPTQIDLMEIVPTGDGGWIERPQTIMITQQ